MLMRAGQGDTRIAINPADPAGFDAVAAAADSRHAFLHHAWYAAQAGAGLETLVASRADGSPLAAFARVRRAIGPVNVSEIAGCYWPFRSLPVAADAGHDELLALLARPELRRFLGPVWRLGPVFGTDPAAGALRLASASAGWAVLERRLGTCFEIDVRALAARGPWPRGSTLKKNRWREKQLGEAGALDLRRFTGADWRAGDRDAIAEIERNSWLADEAKAGLQFADARQCLLWEHVAEDPMLAAMLRGSILSVGGVPAAFTFGLRVGTTFYQIANNYDARFARHSPGRTLLIREFEQAAADGIERISWGSGDAGYKSEMGATAGPQIVDLLFVRSKALAAILRRFWK